MLIFFSHFHISPRMMSYLTALSIPEKKPNSCDNLWCLCFKKNKTLLNKYGLMKKCRELEACGSRACPKCRGSPCPWCCADTSAWQPASYRPWNLLRYDLCTIVCQIINDLQKSLPKGQKDKMKYLYNPTVKCCHEASSCGLVTFLLTLKLFA